MIRSVPQHQTAPHLLPGQSINPLPPEMPGQRVDLPLHKCGERCNLNCLNWRARQCMLGHFPRSPVDLRPVGVTATDKAS